MLQTNNKLSGQGSVRVGKAREGFTIIEVLIVLAIAGLILLIVFLAVPALQRNSRNTQYRKEATGLLAATAENSNNKKGALPAAGDSGQAVVGDTKIIMGLANTKIITILVVEAEAGTTVPTSATYSSAVIRTGAKCNATSNETDLGPAKGIAILYNVESGTGGSVLVCTES